MSPVIGDMGTQYGMAGDLWPPSVSRPPLQDRNRLCL